MEADRVVVIGFSFRDDHINRMIDNTLCSRSDDNFVIYNFSSRSLEDYSSESWAKRLAYKYPDGFKNIHRRLDMSSDSESALNMKEEVEKQS